jgi:hypothetical protein
MQGLGVNDAGASVVAAVGVGVANFLSVKDIAGAEYLTTAAAGAGEIMIDGHCRIPRGAGFQWLTQGTGVQTLSAVFQLGLFPIGLGQDIAF